MLSTGRHWAAAKILALLSVLTVVGCALEVGSGEESESVAKSGDAVIYGVDNRRQVGEHSDTTLRKLAGTSTALLVRAANMNTTIPSNVTFTPRTHQQRHNLCNTPAQTFASEQAPGECSATLIDDDLVLTAGHCIAQNASTQTLPAQVLCADARFVFNYTRDAAGTLRTVTSADVFNCASVVSTRLLTNGVDFAVVRLERAASPRFTPALVRTQRSPLTQGQKLAVIGAPDGMALKIATGAQVINRGTSPFRFFSANTDTFAGNSGSAVYDRSTYQIVGILTAGQVDYVPGPAGSSPAGCQVLNTCSELGPCPPSAAPGVEDVVYIGQMLDVFCASNTSPRLCAHRNEFSFTAVNTNNAQQNSFDHYVFLEPSQTIDFGTCGLPGAFGVGDTFLRLLSPTGAVILSNDDGENCVTGSSHLTFTAPRLNGGLYRMRAGCVGSQVCGGTVAYTVNGVVNGSFSYTATGTNNANQGTRDFPILLRQGEQLTAGTCGVEGSAFTGNTFLRLIDAGVEVASNDNACGGNGSSLTFTATSSRTVTLRAGCSADTECSANVAFTIGLQKYNYSKSNTNFAQMNTEDRTVRMVTGDQITVGTCGMPGATFTGDTLVRVLFGTGATAVPKAANDDACGAFGSLLTFRADATGDYTVRSGCTGNTACTGTTVFQVKRRGTNGVTFTFNETNTNSAQANTTNFPLFLRPGDSVNLGTCPSITGATGTGDTFIRLFGPDGLEVARSDDNCVGSTPLSSVGFSVPPDGGGAYEVRAGCFQNEACSGTVAIRHQ